MKKFSIIYTDLDQVLVDFDLGVCNLFGEDPEIVRQHRRTWALPATLGVTLNQFWEKVDNAGSSFWSGLDSFSWTEELIETVQEASKLVILSSPSNHISSHIGKVTWIKNNLGQNFRNFCLYGLKEEFAREDRLLIDDRQESVDKFREAGESAILFPAYGNCLYSQVPQLEKHGVREFLSTEIKRLENERI